jgi:hypothetical protein
LVFRGQPVPTSSGRAVGQPSRSYNEFLDDVLMARRVA